VKGGSLDVDVVWGAPIPFEATTDRKAATAAAEAAVRAALQGVAAGRADGGTAAEAGIPHAGVDIGGSEIAPA
jgi:lyso-ornithine lipid O-acyltransferase